MNEKNTRTSKVITDLYSMQDERYAAFNASLIPTLPRESVIGVRVPELRKYAKSMPWEEALAFMSATPHRYLEENELHAFLIDRIRDYDGTVAAVEAFLPYIDNWAVCDGMRPRVFKSHTQQLWERVRIWLASEHPYTVRYGIGILCSYFLDSAFSPEQLIAVGNINTEEYYVNMMAAWYFATALAKQRDAALAFIESGVISDTVMNMTVRKAIESYRISDADKAYLRSMKRK